MNQKLIVIDGKTYKSMEEMPEAVRKKYEDAMRNFDKDQNGTPDAFEGMTANVIMSSTKIIADGKTYNSLDELPPEIRAKYEQAMSAMDANRNGIPDFVEGRMNTPNQPTNNAAVSFGTPSPRPASRQPIPVNSTIEPESSGGWLMAPVGILLVGLCLIAAAAGAWYFFLR